MTFCRAPAITLVGWLLIAPPMYGHQLDAGAPISNWTALNSFDSSDECSEAKSDLTEQNEHQKDTVVRLRALLAQCISAADPRLKNQDTPPP
jgi:hypothetical protein